jgi:hypothetical protein
MKYRLILVSAIFAVASACSEKPNQDVLAEDSTLVRDLALANQDSTAEPQLADVPTTAEPTPVEAEPAPVVAAPARVRRPVVRRSVPAPAPSPARTQSDELPEPRITATGNTETSSPAGSEGPLGVVSVGSEISLASRQRICTSTNSVGDRFTAQISNPVMGANGTVIPVGATAIVSISSLRKSAGSGESIEIGLTVESISFEGRTYTVSSETTYAEVDRVRAQSRGDDARKVATGAAIGAVLGGILGGKTKTAVIGAATGAAAGAVVANRNADYDGCVPEGGRITIKLNEPLTIQRS